MKLQPRNALVAAALATTLVACSEDGAPMITGENTVIKGSSLHVFDSNGNNVTAVNQANFPLPEPTFTSSSSGSGSSGGSTGGGTSGGTDSGSSSGGSGSSNGNFYFTQNSAMITADPVGQRLSALLQSIGGAIASEYLTATGAAAFSGETADIERRMSTRAIECLDGSKVSSLVSNGMVVTGGSIQFFGCFYENVALTGDVEVSSAQSLSGEVVTVKLTPVEASSGVIGSMTVSGTLIVTFSDDEFQVTQEGPVSVKDRSVEEVYESIALSGQMTASGKRSISGSVNITTVEFGTSYILQADNATVEAGNVVPTSGSQTLTHSDGSSVRFNNTPGIESFEFTVSNPDDGANAPTEQFWDTMNTTVPFPNGK